MPLISAQFHPIPPDSTICPPFPPLFEFPPHSAARLLFNTASPCGVSRHGCYTSPPALRDSPAHQSRRASHIPRKPHTPKIFCGILRRGCYLLDSVVAYCGMVAARLPPPAQPAHYPPGFSQRPAPSPHSPPRAPISLWHSAARLLSASLLGIHAADCSPAMHGRDRWAMHATARTPATIGRGGSEIAVASRGMLGRPLCRLCRPRRRPS
jgi:hypothetical protein